MSGGRSEESAKAQGGGRPPLHPHPPPPPSHPTTAGQRAAGLNRQQHQPRVGKPERSRRAGKATMRWTEGSLKAMQKERAAQGGDDGVT